VGRQIFCGVEHFDVRKHRQHILRMARGNGGDLIARRAAQKRDVKGLRDEAEADQANAD